MKLTTDPIVQQFVDVYGIRRLLDDMGLEKIRQVGAYTMALCPFHDNVKEPDFQIHNKLGLFNCFGCMAQGNLYQFVQRFYNLSYEAGNKFVQKLAGFDENVNVEDIKFKSNLRNIFTKEKDVEAKPLKKFTEKDLERLNTGEDPTDYLLNRGFSRELIKYFGCTYTDKWSAWDDASEGFINQKRVVIPAHTEYGDIAGFIGRTVENAEPKYKYTSGFPKSTSLFNLHRAKKFADKGLIVVEGSLDTFSMTRYGYLNTVGTYGSRLHPEQIRLLLKYTDKVYLMGDNDSAGQKLMEKAIDDLKGLVELNVIHLGIYKDPGEIPDKQTADNLVQNAYNWQKFELNQSMKE